MTKSPSVYETVTNSIIEELKQGVVPWVRPWKTSAGRLPYNAISERPYSGVNVLLLWETASVRHYANPAWLTFRQANELGGSVKQGEKATAIVYASTATKVEHNDAGEAIERSVPFLKFYSVFNVEQTSGLPERLVTIPESKSMGERLFRAEAFVLRVGATIRHDGDKAYYAPSDDVIVLPRMEDFESLAHYFATNLHEHIHYSGHPGRLDRDLSGRFGTRAYAGEELIAELGAAYLCAHLQIPGQLRHAAYIASWLELLENDRRAIFTAASAASKAAEYLRSLGDREAREAQRPADADSRSVA